MKYHSVWDQPKIDHIAGKTIYPMTIYPGCSVVRLFDLQCHVSFSPKTIEFLDHLHLLLDNIMDEFDVYKVETVNNTCLIASGEFTGSTFGSV